MDKDEFGVLRSQALIDKKQNLIDLRQKTLATLNEAKEENGGEGSNPLEADTIKTKTEIVTVTHATNEAKALWLKQQREYIELARERDEVTKDVADRAKRLLILGERRAKLDAESIALENSASEVKRRAEARDSKVKKLGGKLSSEQERYKEALALLETKRLREFDASEKARSELVALAEAVRGLESEIEASRSKVLEADADVAEWEEKLRTCKETRALVSADRAREGQVERLRNDVHRLQVRAEAVDRKTKEVMTAMQNTVARRDALVDKAINKELKPDGVSATRRTLNNKKADDLTDKVRRLGKEELVLKDQLKARKERLSHLQRELAKNEAFLDKIKSSIKTLEEQTEEKMTEKELNLCRLLRMQTRMRWYRLVKDKRYRIKSAQPDDKAAQLLMDPLALSEQNQTLCEAINAVSEDFPHYKTSLRRIACLLQADY